TRASRDRFVGQIGFKIRGQFVGGAITKLGRFLQALECDHFQVAVDLGIQELWRYRVLLENHKHGVNRRSGLKWWTARQHRIENCAEAVDIRAHADRTAAAGGLLGAHEAGRSDDGASLCELMEWLGARFIERVGNEPLGQSEVAYVRLAV